MRVKAVATRIDPVLAVELVRFLRTVQAGAFTLEERPDRSGTDPGRLLRCVVCRVWVEDVGTCRHDLDCWSAQAKLLLYRITYSG